MKSYPLFTRLKKLSLTTLLVLFISFCSIPVQTSQQAHACAMGFSEDMPRQILLDKEKSALVGGLDVRCLTIDEEYMSDVGNKKFYIPLPGGFMDIESYTQQTLPDWLHTEATNLRDNTMVMPVKPETKGYPEFSFLAVVIGATPAENVTSDCETVRAYLAGESDPSPQELWEKESAGGHEFVCTITADGGDYFVMGHWDSGHVDIEELNRVSAEREERKRKWIEENKELVAELQQKAKEMGMKLSEDSIAISSSTPVDMVTGEDFHISHKAIRVIAGFFIGDVYVKASCQLGPADSPADLKKAYEFVRSWKDDIIKVNQ